MAIGTTALKFLIYCKNEFTVDFTTTAMIGRQNLSKNHHIMKLLCQHTPTQPNNIEKIFTSGYSEELLQHLGAKTMDSFDNSDYEGATHLVDFSKPIPEDNKGKYTLVLDIGASEHIFNVPTVLKNMMDMLAIGGTLISIVPANNWCGHGFYQFSPELYYRLFTEENGFKVNVVAYASSFLKHKAGKLYIANDPKQKLDRFIGTDINKEALLHICVTKINNVNELTTPQQSIYENLLWNTGKKEKRLHQFLINNKFSRLLGSVFPKNMTTFVLRIFLRKKRTELKLKHH